MEEKWVQNEVISMGRSLGLSCSDMGNGHMKIQNAMDKKPINTNVLVVSKSLTSILTSENEDNNMTLSPQHNNIQKEPNFVSYLEHCYESLPLGK